MMGRGIQRLQEPCSISLPVGRTELLWGASSMRTVRSAVVHNRNHLYLSLITAGPATGCHCEQSRPSLIHRCLLESAQTRSVFVS
jgi:hypothetical protein